jgi:hypothetical protein
MKTRKLITALSAALVSTAILSASAFAARPPDRPPGGGGGGGEPEPTQGNNLSFPAISVDGYPITEIDGTRFTVIYTGDYPGLTENEIALLEQTAPWYPQKTEGNTWQADYQMAAGSVDVSYVDWGDNVESQNPKVGRPFRLEVQLYKQLDAPMSAYTMAVLEYPSSSNELQGANTTTYDSNFATVVSPHWKLGIQYCGSAIPAEMTWTGAMWQSIPTCTNVPITFAVELNVGGKLIFGASEGGWKPKQTGWYRITFYSPQTTNLNLGFAQVGDYGDFSVPPAPAPAAEDGGDEGGVATPVVDATYNISYVDVQVVGGGGGKGKPTSSAAPTTKAAPTVTSARASARRR